MTESPSPLSFPDMQSVQPLANFLGERGLFKLEKKS